jgi:glycosyltransferase involved in cell wall biosynthesis
VTGPAIKAPSEPTAGGYMTELRVALLTPCYWPEVRRGAERIVNELATGLASRGHRPRVITSHLGRPHRSVEGGFQVVRNWRPPNGRLRRRGYEDHLTHVPFSYLALRGADHHVAQATHVTDALAAARWSQRTGRPSVLAYMGIPDRRGLTAARRRLEITARASQECTAVTALSRSAADAFARWLGIGARVIHPPVDLDRFSPGGERSQEPTIFCAAAVEQPHKRVGLLIEAFRRLRRDRRDARLVLVRPGNPRLAEALLAGTPGIEFVEQVERPEDLAPAYRRAWVSALTSVGEAFGLVLAESLACGTPVAGSRHGGIPEIVDSPAVGRLFADDDERSVTRALLEALDLARDPATVAACRRRAEAFSTPRFVDAHERLYAELLTSEPPSEPRSDGRR